MQNLSNSKSIELNYEDIVDTTNLLANKNYVTYDSLYNASKALNLNINESEIKKCFEKYDKEIDFETFKKLILSSEEEDKNMSFKRRSSKQVKTVK